MKENKLIADFMDFPAQRDAIDDRTIAYYVGESIMHTDNKYNANDYDVFHPHDMKFHNSWDWLMPVVQKIYQLGLDNESALLVRDALAEANLDNTYKAVVEFIKQYNNK